MSLYKSTLPHRESCVIYCWPVENLLLDPDREEKNNQWSTDVLNETKPYIVPWYRGGRRSGTTKSLSLVRRTPTAEHAFAFGTSNLNGFGIRWIFILVQAPFPNMPIMSNGPFGQAPLVYTTALGPYMSFHRNYRVFCSIFDPMDKIVPISIRRCLLATPIQ